MGLRICAVIAVLMLWRAAGQMSTASLSFDAAAVRIADHTLIPGVTSKMKGGPGTTDPGRITYTQVRLIDLLLKAWNLEMYRVAGPAWLMDPRSEWYTITATMPPETTKPQFQQMLQNLLIERFKIRLHHETRSFPGYELVVAPGGPKLKGSTDPNTPEPATGPTGKLDADGFLVLPPGRGQGIHLGTDGMYVKFQNWTMAELVANLRSFVQQSTGEPTGHIVDKTGLGEKYDFTLKFGARENAVAVAPGLRGAIPTGEAVSGGPASDAGDLPNLFKALERQLGLKLVKVKEIPLDTMVIDHVERVPVEN